MSTSRRVVGGGWIVSTAALMLMSHGSVRGDTPESGAAASTAVPQENFFSSIKQAFNQDFDHEVIRGYFDVGTSPTRRYYCVVDAKTGKRLPNAVPGEPTPRKDGMTGIKATSVSTYSCDSAEQQGILVTAGFVLPAGSAKASAPPPPSAASPVQAAQPPSAPAAERLDVAGIKLGMSPDEVRAVLRSKKLLNYFEAADALSGSDGRYVNFVSAWSASGASAADRQGELYEVMFTPVPGKERAMAVVHSIAYLPSNAIAEAGFDEALIKKYGGYKSVDGMSESPTWRVQSDGSVQVGDSCNRRGLFGGVSEFSPGTAARPNLVLKTALDEFQFQIQQCGVAIATEDHVVLQGNGPRKITRITVSAYSPSLGLAGATAAAQYMATARTVVGAVPPAPAL